MVGLTSAGNAAFVEGLGCYDRVVTYDRIGTLLARDAGRVRRHGRQRHGGRHGSPTLRRQPQAQRGGRRDALGSRRDARGIFPDHSRRSSSLRRRSRSARRTGERKGCRSDTRRRGASFSASRRIASASSTAADRPTSSASTSRHWKDARDRTSATSCRSENSREGRFNHEVHEDDEGRKDQLCSIGLGGLHRRPGADLIKSALITILRPPSCPSWFKPSSHRAQAYERVGWPYDQR